MRIPTAAINARAEIRLTSHPPSGAASKPPSTIGIRGSSGDAQSPPKKVGAEGTETKNSAVLTEPTVWRGTWPDPIRVDVAVGPQPPPPLASRKPAKKPRYGVQPAGLVRCGAIHTDYHKM